MIIDALLRTAVLVADLENISRLNHEIPKLTHTQSSFTRLTAVKWGAGFYPGVGLQSWEGNLKCLNSYCVTVSVCVYLYWVRGGGWVITV